MLAAVSASAFAVVFSLVAGIAGSIQVAVSGALGRRVGVVEAAACGGVVAAAILVVVAVAGRNGGGIAAALREPPWLWLGGVMGAIVVTGITFGPPRIGTFATIALLIAGQLATATTIDAFGLLGAERIPVTWVRVAGLALLALGAALVLKR